MEPLPAFDTDLRSVRDLDESTAESRGCQRVRQAVCSTRYGNFAPRGCQRFLEEAELKQRGGQPHLPRLPLLAEHRRERGASR